jgi:glycosyltransferase involved in cell wall biosynthesis
MTKVSVIILTKNSQKYISECICSVLNQIYEDFEVIIVDAESNDNTLGKILHTSEYLKYYNKLKIINVDSKTSIGKARQIGVDNSIGEIIAFIDSDVELPHKYWLKNMSDVFFNVTFLEGYGLTDKKLNENIAGVQTLSKNKDNDPWILKRVHRRFEYKRPIIDKYHYEMIGTSHILIKKSCIEEVGGFRDVHSSEDVDLIKEIIKRGYVFIYMRREKCYHYYVDGLWHYIKKRWRDKKLALRRILFERKKK